MSNRFTDALHQLEVIHENPDFYLFNWKHLLDINLHLYNIVTEFADYAVLNSSTIEEEFASRWILLGFIAAMSDEDIDELIINWKESE